MTSSMTTASLIPRSLASTSLRSRGTLVATATEDFMFTMCRTFAARQTSASRLGTCGNREWSHCVNFCK